MVKSGPFQYLPKDFEKTTYIPEEFYMFGVSKSQYTVVFPLVIAAQILYEINCLISMGKVYSTTFGWTYQVLSLLPALQVAINLFLNT